MSNLSYLTLPQIAKRLGVSYQCAQYHARTGHFPQPALRAGTYRLYTEDQFPVIEEIYKRHESVAHKEASLKLNDKELEDRQ